ncbi:MAG: FecR family protein [Chitinophagaceae bacterium]
MDESRIWLLIAKKISNEATDQELVELDVLFKSNPDLRYAFSIIDKLNGPSAQDYGLTQEEENNLLEKKLTVIEMTLQAGKNRKQKNRPLIRLQRARWAAAGLMIVVSLSAVYYYYPKKANIQSMTQIIQKNKEVIAAGTPISITLQDGTQVWLNIGSTLKCATDFNKKDRQVILSGEAYFDVKQDAEKPFIVQACSLIKVNVLGTAFNIKAYPQDPYLEATLISGKIAVEIKNNKRTQVILNPHEKVTFELNDPVDSKPAIEKQGENPVKYYINALTPNPVDQHISELSWMRGELAFNDIPFVELAYDLERAYQVKIIFKEEQLKNYHLTGVFKAERLNEVLQALQVTTPFQYDISNKEVILYR